MDIKEEAQQLLDRFDYNNAEYEADYDKNIKLILQAFEKVCRAQRNRDRAVYSINRTKLPHEIKQAILDTPLLTDNK